MEINKSENKYQMIEVIIRNLDEKKLSFIWINILIVCVNVGILKFKLRFYRISVIKLKVLSLKSWWDVLNQNQKTPNRRHCSPFSSGERTWCKQRWGWAYPWLAEWRWPLECLSISEDLDRWCRFFSTRSGPWCILCQLQIGKACCLLDSNHSLVGKRSYPTHHPLWPSQGVCTESTHRQGERFLADYHTPVPSGKACCHNLCRTACLWIETGATFVGFGTVAIERKFESSFQGITFIFFFY